MKPIIFSIFFLLNAPILFGQSNQKEMLPQSFSLGGTGLETYSKTLIDNDDNIVFSSVTYDKETRNEYMYLIKIDIKGKIIWSKILGTGGLVKSMCLDQKSNIYCLLHTNYATIDGINNCNDENGVICKFTKQGKLEKNYPLGSSLVPTKIIINSKNQLTLLGQSTYHLNYRDFSSNSKQGELYIMNIDISNGDFINYNKILQTDSSSYFFYKPTLISTNEGYYLSFGFNKNVVDANSNKTNNDTGFGVCKIDENFKVKWMKKFRDEVFFSHTKSNKTIICGNFKSQLLIDTLSVNSSNLNGDIFITEIDDNGKCIWIDKIESNGAETNCITSTKEDDIYITGAFSKEIIFNNSKYQSNGGTDAFIMSFDKFKKKKYFGVFGSIESDWGQYISPLKGNILAVISYYNEIKVGDIGIVSNGDNDNIFVILGNSVKTTLKNNKSLDIYDFLRKNSPLIDTDVKDSVKMEVETNH